MSEIGCGEELFWELTGDGKCKRLAASLSPGDSKVSTGAPNVIPTRLARAPPRECPITHILDSGLKKKNKRINEL